LNDLYTTSSPAQTEALAARFARVVGAGDLIALEGELGAGKTTFVRGLAQGLGVDPSLVASPSFTLWHEYERAGNVVLIHVDAWRIKSPSELDESGLSDRRRETNAVVVVEWPQRAGAIIDDADWIVRLAHEEMTSRSISLERARPAV